MSVIWVMYYKTYTNYSNPISDKLKSLSLWFLFWLLPQVEPLSYSTGVCARCSALKQHTGKWIDRRCVSPESFSVVNVWMTQPVAKHLGFRSVLFISAWAVCSPIRPRRLNVVPSPSSTWKPVQRFQENATKKKEQKTFSFTFFNITW